MQHVLLPPWPPTYNMTQSTMTQTCFGPTGRTGPTEPKGAALTNASGAFMHQWGIIALDFESREGLWSRHSPKDADVLMVEQIATMKKIAPDTRMYIYRNLVQAYSNFVELRAMLEDPQYAGWFVKFSPHNNETLTPRCAFNPRLGRKLCSDLFHTSLAWTSDGHDCGDVIPCGDYVFDHRNASLRAWLIGTHMLGPMGMGHAAVDGFLIDDWWTAQGEPSEVPHFAQGTGILPGAAAAKALYANWSTTTWAALQSVRTAGGFSWSNVNCELDYYPPGFLTAGGTDRPACGLTKTDGQPRANNVPTAPLWDGPVATRHWPQDYPNSADPAQCASWLREACDKHSVFHQIPTMLGFAAPFGGGPPFYCALSTATPRMPSLGRMRCVRLHALTRRRALASWPSSARSGRRAFPSCPWRVLLARLRLERVRADAATARRVRARLRHAERALPRDSAMVGRLRARVDPRPRQDGL